MGKSIQDGHAGVHTTVPPTRGEGKLTGLQRHLLSYPHQPKVADVWFHYQGQTYHFKVLVFGLPTAPMEFMVMVKEVKLIAQSNCIRIHQYLDNWLIRWPTKDSCHQDTQNPDGPMSGSGLAGKKSELEPKQAFNFVGVV